MSQFTSCVDGLIDQAGRVTVYGCDHDTLRCVRVLAESESRSALHLPRHAVRPGAPVAAVFEPPSAAATIGRRHVFFTRRDGTIGHVVDPGSEADVTLTALQSSPVRMFGVFGAAAHAVGVILVGFSAAGEHTLNWLTCSWADLAANRLHEAVLHHVDISDLVSASDQPTSHSELRFTLATDAKGRQSAVVIGTYKHNKWHVHGQVIAVDHAGAPGKIRALQFEHGRSDRSWALQVQQQPWGEVLVSWVRDNDAECAAVSVSREIDSSMRRVVSPFPQPANASSATWRGWSPGPARATASVKNPRLQDKEVPLRAVVVNVAKHDRTFDVCSGGRDHGFLRRRALTVQQAQKLTVMGIIAGPPPVPHENLNMATRWDHFSPNLSAADGRTVYADQIVSASQLNVEWGVAFFGAFSEKSRDKQQVDVFGITLSEAEANTQFDFALRAEYRSVWDDVHRQAPMPKYRCVVKMAGEAPTHDTKGSYAVEPLGGLIVADTRWTGYTYEYIDAQRRPISKSVSFTTVFPDKVELKFLPFALDPDTYCRPGDLLSYVRSSQTLALFDTHATPLADGARRLASAWAVNNRMTNQAKAFNMTTWTHGVPVNTKSSLTLGGKAGLLGLSEEVEVRVGGEATLGLKYTQSAAHGTGISSQMTVRGNVEAPGTYTHYQWFTYHLRPDKRWLYELMNSLVTPKFPAEGSRAWTAHTALLKQLDRSSQPWLITYALGESGFTPDESTDDT